MANVQWPVWLPFASLRNALAPQPPDLRARTDFDAGTARTRRRALTGPYKHPVRWVWTLDEFELFQAFWKHSLAEGAAWFDMPIFIGRDYVSCACRFVDMFQPSLKGVSWTVDANLEIENRKVMSRAEVNDRWPGSIA